MIWTILAAILIVAAVADALGFLLWYACSWPRSQVLGPALIRGPEDKKRIALTLDDGPLPPYTDQVLDILHSRKIPATFFVCGKNAEQYPEVVRRIHSQGHVIGNHTWSHPYLYFMSRAKIRQEIDRTQKAVQQATGCTPGVFRPPYGGRWFGLYPVLRERGMQLVQWSASGDDWKQKADDIVAMVCSGLRPGAVILLHDGRQESGGYLERLFRRKSEAARPGSNVSAPLATEASASETVKALPRIIDAALGQGWEFVSINDFLPEDVRAVNTTRCK